MHDDGLLHAAVFTITGTEPGDWRTAALVLYERLMPEQVAAPAKARGGRPQFWTPERLTVLAALVDTIRAGSAAGRVEGRPAGDLRSDTAICRYITRNADARARLGLDRDITPGRLQSLLPQARDIAGLPRKPP